MKPKVYIEGREGPAMALCDRLAVRSDVELLLINERKREDLWEHKRMFDASDLVFLCLEPAEAREMVELAEKPGLRLIDCSGAHVETSGWTYALPELSRGHRKKLKDSARAVLPDLTASAFIRAVYPLTALGALHGEEPLCCVARGLDAPAGQDWPPLEEMGRICGLKEPPALCAVPAGPPSITVPLHMSQLHGVSTLRDVRSVYSGHYGAGDKVQIEGNDRRFTITAFCSQDDRIGEAIWCMNLMLGLDEMAGLVVK